MCIRDRADTVLVLKNGEVQEYGAAREILENPQKPYTKKLLAAVPKLQRGERI